MADLTDPQEGELFDLTMLALSAKRKGYDARRIAERLQQIIKHNAYSITRPYRKGRASNDLVAEDNEVFALILAEHIHP